MSKDISTESKFNATLTRHEQKLLEIIRSLDYGEVRVVITDGTPTRIEEIKKSIKL